MTNSTKIEERNEAIQKIVKILNNLPDEDIRYYLTAAETLATRALINQESAA